jgi:Protein of unknown function (DUF4231)
MKKFEHVDAELNRQIGFFRSARNYNRTRVLRLNIASTGLSALATVAIGATKMLGQDWLQLLALVASSIVTVVGVWEAVFSYKKLWSINNVALAELENLKRRLDYRKADPLPVTEFEADTLFGELNTILVGADKAWVETYAVR